ARPRGMKGFAMWDWGHRVTWGVGGVNGIVQVRRSAQEKAVGVMGVLAGNSVEISSSSTTTCSDISLPEYKALYDDHVKEISSGSSTTHSNSFLYDSFTFDLSINPFPPADRSDFYEFADEIIHIISPPEYDCFFFKIEPNSGNLTMDVVEDISLIREPRVHNALPTHPTLQLNLEKMIHDLTYINNSLPEFKTFCFDVEEISSGSTTTCSDISLPEYKAFYDDHVKEIRSGSSTTHSDSSLYDSFTFDLSINPFPPADRSDFYEFADELIHIISPPEYDCFFFKIELNSGNLTMDVVEDISLIREPRVHNALPTHPTLQLNLEFKLSSESLFTYVVWIFLHFLLYSVAPQYLLSLGNEDTIFDPDICSYPISSF
nr:hypothetical protein [Tanacetum cinerariifolium]